jgi:hypothetical protein
MGLSMIRFALWNLDQDAEYTRRFAEAWGAR